MSQIAFSHNMFLMGCLISGAKNGIIIYGINKEMKLEQFSKLWFSLEPQDMQIVTRMNFTSNMQEISVTGPNRELAFYRLAQPDLIKNEGANEQSWLRTFRDFIPQGVMLTHSWNGIYDDTVYKQTATDGRIIAVVSDKGHICVALNDPSPDEKPILLLERHSTKKFCDVVVTQRALVAATFAGELFFYELDNSSTAFVKTRKSWSFTDSSTWDCVIP